MDASIFKFASALKPKQRWAQFSLRTLFVLVLGLAMPLAWLKHRMDRKEAERAAVVGIDRWFVWLRYDWEVAEEKEPPGPKWARALLGDDFFANLVYAGYAPPQDPHDPPNDEAAAYLADFRELRTLHLGCDEISDAGLYHLRGLTQLEDLSLNGSRATGAGLAHLKGLSRLRRLSLLGTGVADDGLANIEGLSNLEELRLNGTKITDEGLASLRSLKNLKRLELCWTATTDAGLAYLTELNELESLDLRATRITDSGLVHLKGLTSLKDLTLNAEVTDEGIGDLQKSLHGCAISR